MENEANQVLDIKSDRYEIELIDGDRKIYIKVEAGNINDAFIKARATRGKNASNWRYGECKKL